MKNLLLFKLTLIQLIHIQYFQDKIFWFSKSPQIAISSIYGKIKTIKAFGLILLTWA